MSLLEYAKALNDYVETHIVESQQEVNNDATIIVLDDNTCITFEEDDEEMLDN